jgi:hypothetical protein
MLPIATLSGPRVTEARLVLRRLRANARGYWLLAVLLICGTASYSENIKAERHRAEQILNLASRDRPLAIRCNSDTDEDPRLGPQEGDLESLALYG